MCVYSEDVRKIGFSQAEITYKVDLDKETNRVSIAFNVAENKRVKIKNIIIEGNKAFSDRRIINLLKTKSAWFFNAGVLKEEVLSEDIETHKSFYHREGFTDVAVDYEVKPWKEAVFIIYNHKNTGRQEIPRGECGDFR